MPRYVLLDIDGTLMDTNYAHVEAWARALADVGLEVPRREIHRQIGKSSSLLIGEFVEDEADAERVEERHSELYAGLQEHTYPLPGAVDLIRNLSEVGYETLFVTSAKPQELERHIELLEAEGRISDVVLSSDVESGKPAPDVFEEALRRTGAAPEDAVAVGDSIWDVQSAGGAGVRTVAVLSGGTYSEAELREAGALDVVRDCAALLASGFPQGVEGSSTGNR